MKVTVCELSNDPSLLPDEWEALARHVREAESGLCLLPEMPFFRWLPATRKVDPAAWEESVAMHERWAGRLGELGAGVVLLTRPVIDNGRRYNESLVWGPAAGQNAAAHRKRYLPDENGFWEASWYSRGGPGVALVDAGGCRIGFAICTELWFLGHAREYGRRGVQLLAVPRATPESTVGKWIAGGRTAAVVSGAFCLSSNFSGRGGRWGDWGGTGWVIEPEHGRVLGTTSRHNPFLTVDIDLRAADAAKSTYPRYVPD